MKDEVRRIMQLVKDGKLSPEDAAELIEAFQDAPEESAETNQQEEARAESVTGEVQDPPPGSKARNDDPFARLIGSIEKATKDVAHNIDWKDISNQVRMGVGKGVDAIKEAAKEAKVGKGPFGNMFSAQVTRTVDLPLQVPEGKIFVVESSSGDVRIEGGHDIGSVNIEAGFRSYNNEEAEALADRFTPALEESEDSVTLKQLEPNGVTADITVKLAKGTQVVVRLASGDVSVSDTFAGVTVKSSSGDIRVSAASGVAELSTSSGDVRVSHSDLRSISVETKSGDVILDHAKGAANIRTSSGDVTLYNYAGRTLAIEAASGNIVADLIEPVTGTANIRTVSGDITMHMPDGSDARVSLSTLRGEVTCKLPLTDENKESMKVTGTLGGGGGLIDVSAVNGDLFVALAGAELKEEPTE